MFAVIVAIFLAISAFAEDAPKPPPEQQIDQLKQQLDEAQAELRLYQRGLFQCQAAEIHAQAAAQAKAKVQDKTK